MVGPVRMLEGGGAAAPVLAPCYARRARVANPLAYQMSPPRLRDNPKCIQPEDGYNPT
jgi:hypothetical protein